jgi:hypothetical protein
MPRTRPSSRRARRFRMEFSLSRNGSFGCKCDEWRTFDLNPIRVGGTQRNTAGCVRSGERRELSSFPNERQFENGVRGGAARYTGTPAHSKAWRGTVPPLDPALWSRPRCGRFPKARKRHRLAGVGNYSEKEAIDDTGLTNLVASLLETSDNISGKPSQHISMDPCSRLRAFAQTRQRDSVSGRQAINKTSGEESSGIRGFARVC